MFYHGSNPNGPSPWLTGYDVSYDCHAAVQIEYYDGQFDDARYALALAQTAALHGAAVLNHITCVALMRDGDGRVCGARVRDNETGETVAVHARVVVNATGPFTDAVRAMADTDAKEIIMPSSGAALCVRLSRCGGTVCCCEHAPRRCPSRDVGAAQHVMQAS